MKQENSVELMISNLNQIVRKMEHAGISKGVITDVFFEILKGPIAVTDLSKQNPQDDPPCVS